MPAERYELTRSIIHKCPALKLPQTFIQKLGATAQIVPLRGLTDEQARAIADRLNIACRVGEAIHYPECWDTAAYPTVAEALAEVFAAFRCTNDACGVTASPGETNGGKTPMEGSSDE